MSLATSLDGPSQFQPRPEMVDPGSKWRLGGFLFVHTVAYIAQVMSMVNFYFSGNTMSAIGLSVPILSSGAFCSYAAWHSEAPVWAPRCLPLKRLPIPCGLLLCIPLGLLQGIVGLVALEDYSRRRSPTSQGQQSLRQLDASSPNKFHCKAVNGLFEGLLSASIILYCYWTLDYPEDDPITTSMWKGEPYFLAAACWVLFVSSGLGLLELDYCVSRAISRQMRRSMCYEVVHIIFRTCEVATRVSMLIWFTVNLRLNRWWWWVPPAADFLITFVLVTVFGGAESKFVVRVLCSVPCMFANVFLFIDSPYKRRAAVRLTRALTIQRFASTVILPAIALKFGCVCRDAYQGHAWIVFGALSLYPIYWFLLWFVSVRRVGKQGLAMPDIYSACERGSVIAVRSAIRGLTHSAAVGLNVNCADTDGYTPLMLAAAGGHAKVCALLIQEGAQADVPMFDDNLSLRCWVSRAVRRKWTAVHIAAARGHLEVLRKILEDEASSVLSNAASLPGAFQDAMGETPLHIAARAGHVEVVQVLATKRPQWLDVINFWHQRPVDVARSEEVKGAFNAISTSGRDSMNPVHRLSSVLSVSPRSSLEGVRAPEEFQGSWESVELQINRTTQEIQRVAPGLCSYIVSSCGGALARIFLANAPAIQQFRSLSRISEASEDGFRFSLTEDPGQGLPRVQSRDIALQNLYDPWRGNGDPAGPTMDDLEPIDKYGEPVARWQTAVQNGSVSMGPQASGRGLSQIPYEAVLGEGSYGIVWRAKERSTHTWYAVKTIKTSREGGEQSSARRECDVADRIRLIPHPCLVRLYHVHNYMDSGVYTLIMEFCEGGDLLGRVRRVKQESREQQRPYQPPRPAHKWIGQIFLGLEHMHKRMETLLRDLKPENVVLDRQGAAKLTDFGFGRFGLEASGIWSFGIPVGSPGYVAPEVLRQEEYDFKADLYSLGVLVWVLLTGGLTKKQEPVPPMGVMRHNMDFEAHFTDCRMLAQCIAEPEQHNARRMKENPRDFVARLTHERPDQRLNHEDIRNHRFFQVLGLPTFEAPPSAVEAWLTRATSAPPTPCPLPAPPAG